MTERTQVRRRVVRRALGLLITLSLPLLFASPGVADVRDLEVEEYRRITGLPQSKAEENLEIQRQAVGIVDQLEDALGERYAGVWFDAEAGEFAVAMTSESVRSVVAEEFSEDRIAGSYRAGVVDHSWEELQDAQEQIDGELAKLYELNLVDTSIDPRTNAVLIRVDDSASEEDLAELARISAAAPVRVEVEQVELERFQPVKCNDVDDLPNNFHPSCGKPLRGGVEIAYHNNNEAICTAGFRAMSDTSDKRYLLTAGHCAGPQPVIHWDAFNEHSNLYIGQAEQVVFPGHDWMKINATGSGWDQGPWPGLVVA